MRKGWDSVISKFGRLPEYIYLKYDNLKRATPCNIEVENNVIIAIHFPTLALYNCQDRLGVPTGRLFSEEVQIACETFLRLNGVNFEVH